MVDEENSMVGAFLDGIFIFLVVFFFFFLDL